ncbi:DUF6942 family protein [Pseudoalteromonas sp. SSM20]|uniref:DUF6942 family protein n=1 Tax=Pseudoalteromonas sp. SSM20 TaxID=3139394 RepID=UPI003BAAB99E
MSEVGFGCNHYRIAFYVENAPLYSHFASPQNLIALPKGAIKEIGAKCGNGWRKQFNVFAKFIYTLHPSVFNGREKETTWQQYRDNHLLQQNSSTALLFSPPDLSKENVLHIIAGRCYAKKLINTRLLNSELCWLNQEFAFNCEDKVLVCPFLDYRQLSNIKIDFLAQMCHLLVHSNAIELDRFHLPEL